MNVAKSVVQRQSITQKPESKGISWQDLTPTCDIVISDMAREHATIIEWLSKCQKAGSPLADFDTALQNAKKTLRMINIDSIEDPELRDTLLKLRRRQIVDYTTMRKDLGQILNAETQTERATPDMENPLIAGFIERATESLSDFSKLMAEFTVEASILPDEIDNMRARHAIFSAFE